MKRIATILVYVVLIVLVSAVDVAFLPSFGKVSALINFTLLVSLYLLLVVNKQASLKVFFLATTVTTLSAGHQLFLPLICGFFTLVLIDWLFESFFSNRSYLTLISLSIIGWLFYYSVWTISISILSMLTSTIYPAITFQWIGHLAYSLVFVILILSIFYIVTVTMNKRLRSYFILNKK